jgi:tetratricopeptide (TPR) repeat protein
MKSFDFFRIPGVILIFFALMPWAAAQQGRQEGNTGPPDTSKSAPKVSPPQIGTPRPDLSRDRRREPPLVFISGTVVREDGSLPPFGAVIELDCGGSVSRQTTVNANGQFWFQVGDVNRLSRAMPDASEGFGQDPLDRDSIFWSGAGSRLGARATLASPNTRLAGCEIRAQLSGYRSSLARFEAEPQPGANDMGTIVIYPIERVQGTTVSATSLLAPKESKKSLERAKKAIKKQRFNEAEEHLKSATIAYPEYGEAWYYLGMLYQNQNRNAEAHDAYMKALKADRLYVNPYVRLGWLASKEKKWREAADFTDHALALNPVTLPEAYFLNSLANWNLKDLDAAEKSARQLLRLDPKHRFPKIFLILSNICAVRNDTAGSIEEMRNYLRYAPDASDADKIKSLLQEKVAQAAAK